MGLSPFHLSDCSCSDAPLAVGDPKNFRLLHHEKHGRFLIVEVEYPGCTTFKGKKLLVFEAVSYNAISKLTALDPHFCDDRNHVTPIARFVPTVKGWNFARAFCKGVQP